MQSSRPTLKYSSSFCNKDNVANETSQQNIAFQMMKKEITYLYQYCHRAGVYWSSFINVVCWTSESRVSFHVMFTSKWSSNPKTVRRLTSRWLVIKKLKSFPIGHKGPQDCAEPDLRFNSLRIVSWLVIVSRISEVDLVSEGKAVVCSQWLVV